MSLRVAVAAPFREAGTRSMEESRFVVALSLDRDWFSPDQAKRLIDVAVGEGLLERTEAGIEATFPVDSVGIPEDFSPAEDLLAQRSPFERVLERVVADGIDKRTAVGRINELQREIGISIEVAAVVFARREGIDVSGELSAVRGTLNREG
ncbi:DUF2240 family protein [Halalkalicoccus jeotgali]|uniref:DUF2240 family protein n=1 Tax=Halalkalicoccus jeotgali (strain DSM 18796 / CECT 7217 / JCM 14584 / KCTC 4019 / B3) TaxID=795797 RepID=D8J8Q2_HALJB|nr:DUF2240 family protein [Halalkalicoccus jeotgali]ADJ14237.1 hypothetical protein HacjB3_04230 [Halalkalicoccus jeotgali B3]ELY40499.1 hypothetical protein C497_02592 [Halalkalicoccus jeotgali B3]